MHSRVPLVVILAAAAGSCGDGFTLTDARPWPPPIDAGHGDDGGGVCDGCNPMTQGGCGGGEKCGLAIDPSMPDVDFVRCNGTGAAADGDPCVFRPHRYDRAKLEDDCQKGLACHSEGGQYVCRPICCLDCDPTGCEEGLCAFIHDRFLRDECSGYTPRMGLCLPSADQDAGSQDAGPQDSGSFDAGSLDAGGS